MTIENRPHAAVLVANSIAMEVGSNNPVIIGAFNALESRVFPVRTSYYAIAKVWGMPAGQASCQIRLSDAESGQVVATVGEHKFSSAGPADVHTAISLFQNVTVPKSGVYHVEVATGGQVIGHFPLSVNSPKA